MGIVEIFFIALGLAMDAFTFAICKGILLGKVNNKVACKVGFYFGFFQALMPIIGFFLGFNFRNIVVHIDHWIAFCFLIIIGVNSIYNVYCSDEKELDLCVNFSSIIISAIATSIDALAVGITFVFLKVDIWLSSMIIGLTTFILSALGLKLGSKIGNKGQNYFKLIGGIVLILMGIKILYEHLQ